MKKKAGYAVIFLVLLLLSSCNSFQPGKTAQVIGKVRVNPANYSVYEEWYDMQPNNCMISGTVDVIEEGSYYPNFNVQTYKVSNEACVGYIAGTQLKEEQ